jgi:hypothetical protein
MRSTMSGGVAQLEHDRTLVEQPERASDRGGMGRAILPIAGALFVTAIAVLQWRLWQGGLGTPVSYEGDSTLFHRLTSTTAREGWFFTNPLLGFPHEQVTYDFPRLAEGPLQFLGLKVLTWVSSDPFLVNNVFLLLTFPAIFATAWFVFRRLRFSPAIACTAAVVYTLLPYHFVRHDVHLLLAAYWAVPLGCLLLYDLLTEEPGGEPGPPTDWRERFRRLVVSRWFWIPIVVGAAGGYAALFFAYLVGVVGIAMLIRHRDARRLIRPLLCVALTVVVLLASTLPTFIYQWRHGPNHEAAERFLGENDVYGLQLGYLVLPIDNHRIPALSDFKEQLNDSVSPLRDPELQSVGTLAAIGLFVSLGALLVAATTSAPADRWGRLRRQSGALNVAAILLGTVGGLSILVGLFGFLQLRAYNRLSIFIAFFSLVALAAAIEPFLARPTLRRRRIAIPLVVVAVCLFAAFDQTAVMPTHRDETVAAVTSDRRFVQHVERQLGGNGEIFQLPLVQQPEITIPGLDVDHDLQTQSLYSTEELGKPALFSDSLRWSWGAMRGRPEDLTPSYVGRPLEHLLRDLDAIGFDGIYIDRRGFVDRGAEIEDRLETITGTTALVSDDGTKSFFDIRPYRSRLPPPTQEAREAARHPLQLDWDDGFGFAEGGAFYPQLSSVTTTRSVTREATLRVTNTRPAPRRLAVHTSAQLVGSPEGKLDVRALGARHRFDVSAQPMPIVIEFDIPPGTTTIKFHTDVKSPAAQDSEAPVLSLRDVWFEGPLATS